MSFAGSMNGIANHRATPAADSSLAPPNASARALITDAILPASSTVGTTSSGLVRSGTGPQLLAPDIGAPEDAHAGPLVEPGCAGRVLTVDAERGHRLAAVGEAPEALLQQRQPEASAPPRGSHPEQRDEAPVAETLLVVDCHGGDLAPVPDDEDELG